MPIDPRPESRYKSSEASLGSDQSAIKNRQSEIYLLLLFINIDVLGIDDVVFTARRLTARGGTRG